MPTTRTDSPSRPLASEHGSQDLVKTSVIIPVYNTEDYLEECLESVLAQTQREIEVILVDDGSTDSSPEIERRYAERDPRVRVIFQENQRQGAARNRGLEAARGEYVYFLDSDDIIIPTHFETCYRACEEDGLDFVTFDTVGFVDDPDVERPELFQEICDRAGTIPSDIVDGVSFWHSYQHSGMLPLICWMEYLRRDFVIDNALQFVEGIFFEDNDWVVRAYMAARRIKYLPLKLHRYRHRPGSNVHAGFTHVLAETCFDVHDVLCNLARGESDPRRVAMIIDVSFIKDCRFEQFCELEPTDGLRAMVATFAERIEGELSDAETSDPLRAMHLNALLKLVSGVSAWRNPPLSYDGRQLARLICSMAPSAREASRIGIYGTGNACEVFLKHFDLRDRMTFFIESKVVAGQRYRGKPVYGIDAAADLNLDVVFITSEKHAHEMRANVSRFLGEAMPVYVVPRFILALKNRKFLFKLKYPGLYRFVRKLKAAVRR